MKRILIPLPNKDFDLTEVAVPWRLFKNESFEIVFATEDGQKGQVDPLLISGVVFGQLGAKPQAISFYRELEKSNEFLNPIKFEDINLKEFDLLHLPGGHAKGMIPYLENKTLQEKVLEFYKANKTIGAICHGGIILARTINPETGKSIIYNYKVTALTKFLEKTAYYITAWKHGNYYRTYPEYVQDEVSRNLISKKNFICGFPFKAMIVEDENFITARWPLDAKLYAETLVKKLKKST